MKGSAAAGSAEAAARSLRFRLRVVRGGLTLFLAYHLLAVTLSPNKDTYLGHVLGPWLEPYVNVLELAPTWAFFAPEPGPPPLYVEWELLDSKGKALGREKWPAEGNPFFLRERQNRRITFARYLVSTDANAEKVLTPYLCGQDPRVRSIRLWRLVNLVPGLKDVAEGRRSIGDEREQERHWVVHNFCSGGRPGEGS